MDTAILSPAIFGKQQKNKEKTKKNYQKKINKKFAKSQRNHQEKPAK